MQDAIALTVIQLKFRTQLAINIILRIKTINTLQEVCYLNQ